MREFRGDDNASMDANNSSAFNARPITGGGGYRNIMVWHRHQPGSKPLEFDSNGTITVKPSQLWQAMWTVLAFARVMKLNAEAWQEDVVDPFAHHHGFMIRGGD